VRLDEELGVTYRQLDFWSRKGYIKSGTSGSGIARSFSSVEKDIVRLMGRLVRAGFQPRVAAEYAREVVETPHLAGTAIVLSLDDGIKLRILIEPSESTAAVRSEPDTMTSRRSQQVS
jgi:DNA-binding transcriptional MerR regulator